MALDATRRNALLSSRRECSATIGPLADRVLWELAHHQGVNGGPVLNPEHELTELKSLPDAEKINKLWALMTKKGARGWDVLVTVLDKVSPSAREILEGKVEELRRQDQGYCSQANTPSENQLLGVPSWHQESTSVSPPDQPVVLGLGGGGPHNESQAAYENGRQQMAFIRATPIDNLRNSIKNDSYDVGDPVESAGAHSLGGEAEVVRNAPLNCLGPKLQSVLAQEFNPNRDFLAVVGRELGAPEHILKVCQRAGNPTGLLLSNIQNGVTLDDLCGVLNRYGRHDIWDKLIAAKN